MTETGQTLNETPCPSPIPSWEMAPDAPDVVYNWVDVTDQMKLACDELQLGELVHEPNFGLFEAMSAIEMMDPKMDAGMVGKKTKRKVLNLQQAIEAKAINISELDHRELIGIMDTCLCCLLSWLEGQSLAQTVFTCLYLHDPSLIEDRCLRAYSLCLLKLCDLIREKVNRANVFEEEDFQTLTYGFKFADNITDMRVVGMMKEVEDEYARKIRNLKSIKSSGEEESSNLQITECNGIVARIKFLRLLLQVLMMFGKKEAESIQPVKKLLYQMSEHLNIINRTVHLGIDAVASDDGHMIMHGFEPLVNQKLLPPTFPRYATLRSREEIHQHYSAIIKRLITVTDVTQLSGFHNILEFITKFSRTVPCVLSRSVLQLLYMPENRRVFGQHVVTEVIRESARSFNSPPVLSPRYPALMNHPTAKLHADMFLSRATRVSSLLVQTYGHNRARHREKLAAILEDLGAFQEESDHIDAELHKLFHNMDLTADNSHLTCLGSWSLYHTLRVMIQYILSGFELELYSPHEFHYIYWYLAEILLSWMLTTLNRAESQLAKEDALMEQQEKVKGRNSKKNKRNKKKAKVHAKELQLTMGMQMMGAGCFKTILGLTIAGKIRNPNFSLDSECTRYEHRFLPFVNVQTPPFMLYSQFHEMTDVTHYYPPPTPEHLYMSGTKHFNQAKLYYEEIVNPSEEVQNLCKVAKTNIVVTKLLAGGHKKDSPSKAEFDFSVCPYFPIFKVV